MKSEVAVATLSDKEKNAIRRRRKWEGWLGHLGNILLTGGSLSLAVAQFISEDVRENFPWLIPVLVWGGVILTAAGLVYTIFKGPRYARIISEHHEAKERAMERSTSLGIILDSALRMLMDDLDADFSNARISVYRHKGSNFILLDRVSQKQSLERFGRDQYPDSEGVIGRVWDLGEAVVTRLPEDREQWEHKCVKTYGMSADTAHALSMQSRSLVGKRIDLPGTVPVGLILLESEASQGVNGVTLDKITSSPNYTLLSLILQEVVKRLDEQDIGHFRSTRQA